MSTAIRLTVARSAQALRATRQFPPLRAGSTSTFHPLRAPRQLELVQPRVFVTRRYKSTHTAAPVDDGPVEGTANAGSENPAIEAPPEGYKPQKIAQLEPRLQMTFTCTANDCGHRSTHEFSKRAYTKGLVLVQCPECKSRHLIADHIGWFKESLEGGKLKTVEDLLAAKGEKIRKGRVNFDGDIEYEGEG
ncbi:hypothetical protein IAU60_004534 [Kwoniella sp. DSM 27419]